MSMLAAGSVVSGFASPTGRPLFVLNMCRDGIDVSSIIRVVTEADGTEVGSTGALCTALSERIRENSALADSGFNIVVIAHGNDTPPYTCVTLVFACLSAV